jgi:catechol 2,3-dioxygenase-like lactoylglutathione lyase family enzyme
MIINYQQAFHTGVRVEDIDAAMAEMHDTLGVRWASVQHSSSRSLWMPDHGLEQVELTFVYSCDGPHRIELLQGAPGTVWDAGDHPGVHHMGVWSDDVAADTDAVVAAGWSVAAAAAPPEDGYGTFAYVQPPSGMIVELVSAAARPRFEAWWAGGDLGSARR